MEPTLAPTPQTPSRNYHLKRIAFIAITLAALVTTIEYVMERCQFGKGFSDPIAVAVGNISASALFTIEGNELVPLTVTVDGEAHPVLDYVPTESGDVYVMLAERSATPLSNVYKKDANGSVTKITTSQSVKYNLSYNAQSNQLLYQALTSAKNVEELLSDNWDVVAVDAITGVERVVGTGTDPVFTSPNTSVYRSGAELVAVNIETGSRSTLMNLPSPKYVFSRDGSRLAIFNPVTQKIDQFVLTGPTALSYVSSSNEVPQPAGMGYVGEELVSGYVLKQEETTVFSFTKPFSPRVKPLQVAATADTQPIRIYAY